MKNSRVFYFLAIIFTLTLMACDKDDPEIPNEEELITTMTYTLTPDGGGTPLVLSFQDTDGDGGNAPVITTDNLAANSSYTATISLLNETETPAGNITAEVAEEAVDHQLFYQSSLAGTSVAYDDSDGNGKPLGLMTRLTTTGAGTGTLTITLRHKPDKSATGVADGNIENADGETDIEVTFDLTVQ